MQVQGAGPGKGISLMSSLLFTIDLYPKKSHHDRQSSQSHSQKPNHSPSIQVSIQATSQSASHLSIHSDIYPNPFSMFYLFPPCFLRFTTQGRSNDGWFCLSGRGRRWQLSTFNSYKSHVAWDVVDDLIHWGMRHEVWYFLYLHTISKSDIAWTRTGSLFSIEFSKKWLCHRKFNRFFLEV